LDGSSIDLEYSTGKLISAITRGDGFIGEQILSNVKKMKNVKTYIKGFTGSLRGEIFLFANDYEMLNKKLIAEGSKPLSNPRNGATGIAKRYDGTNAEYLTILYYDLDSKDLSFTTEDQKMEYIELKLGLKVCFYDVVSVEKAITYYDQYEDGERANTPYDIDGLVFKTNNISYQKSLGKLGENPKGQIAWKFTSMKAETEIIDIEWSLGNRRMTPVGIMKPVQCGGVMISRASLSNLSLFKDMNLGKGDKVLISRRNDVIPHIESVIESKGNTFKIPTQCPSCNEKLVEDGKFLICPNDNCDGLAIRNLRKWIDKLEIMDIGESIITSLFNHGFLEDPSDFYKLSTNDIASIDGLGRKSADKIIEHLEEKKEIPLPIFIAALNMTDFSTSTAESLVENGIDTIDKMFTATLEDLVAIKGIEAKTASQIIKGLKEKKQIIQNLFSVGIKIKEKENKVMSKKGSKLSGKSFCFTGKIEKIDDNGDRYTRDKMTELVIENGGDVADSVRKGLTYLVQADPNSHSSKTKKALQMGVEILSESDFFKMIG
jgi:DNA ligase (NAD+)